MKRSAWAGPRASVPCLTGHPGERPRPRRLLVVPLLGALVLGLPGLIDQAAVPPPTNRLVGDAVWAAGRRPAPLFQLRDWRGGALSLAALRGHVVLLTFMDSLCRTDCPVEAAELHLVRQRLGPRLMPTTVIVSTDPRGDTRAHVRAFARRYDLQAPFDWLVGPARRLAAVWRAYGIAVTSASTHSSAIYLLDRWGDEREGWGIPFPPSVFIRSVRVLEARYSTGWRWPWNL